jgi:hypothetical protein
LNNIKPVYSRNHSLSFTSEEIHLINTTIGTEGDDLLKDRLTAQSRDSDIYDELLCKILMFLEEIKSHLKDEFNLRLEIGNWGLRNESGRRVPPEGHVHVRDNIYFTTITTISGDGPWYELDGEKITCSANETVIFSEELFLEKFPEYNLKPILHGSPQDSLGRLVLLCSFVPVSEERI